MYTMMVMMDVHMRERERSWDMFKRDPLDVYYDCHDECSYERERERAVKHYPEKRLASTLIETSDM